MSNGPIAQERRGRLVSPPAPIKIVTGDIVTPRDYPPGFSRWRVIDIPVHPVPSDIVLIESVLHGCPMPRTQRYARDLELSTP